MKHTIETIMAAYKSAPVELQGFDTPAARAFHGWLFGLVLECVAPYEEMVLIVLTRRGEQSTEELIKALGGTATPQQMGVTLSRLRRFGLVHTIRSRGVAYHDLGGWARIGAPMWKAGRP